MSLVRTLGPVSGVTAALLLAAMAPASAATTFTQVSLTATVSGGAVTASATIRARAATTVAQYGICVRDRAGTIVDFPDKKANALITTSGTRYTSATKTFAAGAFTYYPCVLTSGKWVSVGKKTFTVTTAGPTPAPTPPATPSPTAPTPSTPSGADMPTVSTRPGWTYSYGQDFTTPAAAGTFPSVYGSKWGGYDCARCDTSRNGSYRPWSVLSVADGLLDIDVHHDAGSGEFRSAAPMPQPPPGVHGDDDDYLGMRTTVRFKATGPIPGYKAAWLYWPASWDWDEGEIDFPEGELDGTIGGFSHEADTGNPGRNVLGVSSSSTFSDAWRTATTEWVPGRSVELFLDGRSLGRTTDHVPTKPMDWILQTETSLSGRAPSTAAAGHVQVDWLTVEAYTG